MKLFFFFTLSLLICYIHLTSSESSTKNKSTDKSRKEKDKASTKSTGNTAAKGKGNEFTKHNGNSDTKSKVHTKNANGHTSSSKAKQTPNIRTPFDKILDKLSNCTSPSSTSPSIVEVMQENLKELQGDEKYISLFNAAPHTAAFLNKKKQDSTKFIGGLRQALHADWSNPTWKSGDEIDTLFRPFKQQFVYTMMRFNCT